MFPIKYYNENYHGVWQHVGINWSCLLLFLSSKHTLVLTLISYSLYWSHILLHQLSLSSHWSQYLEGSVVDCLESYVHLCLLFGDSVTALRILVMVQFRINMWKMSQPRQNWDETRKSDILLKLQMLKGDAINCLLSLMHQILIDHLLCARSPLGQRRYRVEWKELMSRKDTLTSNLKKYIECYNIKKIIMHLRGQKGFKKNQGKLTVWVHLPNFLKNGKWLA